ncbi:hypothetical protein O181_093471 [Austropuccinia psidii MF-1]|uniref:Reverse transcriptase Ty1/copia-type domain-containing protein n=1 Tax=Austropuccinia psidii MF-1 TaxID=1389203 RepID=A0A9Q3J1J6_9BASI|nr:hypothetical protein [Austropuccinia psidii MF-1]
MDVRFDEDKLPLINKAIDNTQQIEYGSFKRIEPEDKTVISAPEDIQENQINAPVLPLETTPQIEDRDLLHQEIGETNEGVKFTNKKFNKPCWDWKIQPEAPQDISSKILTNNILTNRQRHQAQISENINKLLEEDKNNWISVALTAKETDNKKYPATYEAAKRSPEAIKWKEAAFSEFDSIVDRGVFELIRRKNVPNKKSIINTRWVFTKKCEEKGQIKKYKGRCVARGFKQKEGIDYTETFSSTGRLTTMRFLLSHTAITKQKVRQAHLVTAYLNSKLPKDESFYIELPDGFVYWLKETKPTTYIEEIEIELINNPKTFVRKIKKGPCMDLNKLLEADDIILIGKETNNILKRLEKDFKVKDCSLASHILGIKISQSDDMIILSQQHYIEELISQYGLADSKLSMKPMQSNIKLETATDKEHEEFKKLNINYRAAIGSLNYSSQCTRPDLAYTVGTLSQFLEKPGLSHWLAFKGALKYLRKTKDLGLTYNMNCSSDIIGYSDSSWAEENNRKSCCGYVFTYGGAGLSWRSKRLNAVSVSLTESEFRAILGTFQEGKWLHQMHSDITSTDPKQTLVYCDNQGAINRAKNEVYHSRTKHIDVHYNCIIDCIKNNFICLKYITTNEMVADCMTKALDRVKHQSFNIHMGLNNIESYVANISLCMLGSRGCVEESNQKHASERKASVLYKRRKLLKRKAPL